MTENQNNVSIDFTEFKEIINKIKENDNSTKNIFKILHQETYENKHSIFLGWLFNRFASHGIKSNFAQAFFDKVFELNNKEIKIDASKIQNIILEKRINGEKQIKEKKDKRRIDILIEGSDFVYVIENKYGSSEHNGQCKDYRDYVENEVKYKNFDKEFVFLDIHMPKDFKDNPNYANYDFISYHEIKEILNGFLDKIKDEPQKTFITQYIEILNDLYISRKENLEIKNYFDNNFTIDKILKICAITDEEYESLEFDEKRFVDVIKNYYQIKKNENDKIILECLQNICQDKDFFKSDYGQKKEMYAHTIPVLLDFLSTNYLPDYLFKAQELLLKDKEYLLTKKDIITQAEKEKYKSLKANKESIKKERNRLKYLAEKTDRKQKEEDEYKKLKAKIDQIEKEEKKYKDLTEKTERTTEEEAKFKEFEIKKEQKQKEDEEYISLDKKFKNLKKVMKKEKGIEKRNKDEIPFQTIDYVGPSAECEHITIDILAGYIPIYSKYICNTLTDEEQMKKIFDLKDEKNWKIEFLFYIRNGSGSFISIKESDNDNDVAKKELKIENPKELFNVLNMLKKFYEANGRLLSFALSKNQEKNEEELNKLLSYFKDFKFKDSNISIKQLLSTIISTNKYEEILIGCAIDLKYVIEDIDLNTIDKDKDTIKQKLQEIFYKKTIEGTKVYNYHKWFEDKIFLKDLKEQYVIEE